jgi:hypothetical protein
VCLHLQAVLGLVEGKIFCKLPCFLLESLISCVIISLLIIAIVLVGLLGVFIELVNEAFHEFDDFYIAMIFNFY